MSEENFNTENGTNEQTYSQPQQTYSQPQQTYSQPQQAYEQPQQNYDQQAYNQNQQYAQQNYGYDQSQQGYGTYQQPQQQAYGKLRPDTVWLQPAGFIRKRNGNCIHGTGNCIHPGNLFLDCRTSLCNCRINPWHSL